jgi:hypothetical protein
MQGKIHPLTKRQQYWLDKIEDWKSSGKTNSDYSREQGFTAQAMYAGKKNWLRKVFYLDHKSPVFSVWRYSDLSENVHPAWL